jgi:hypothetical protein
MENKYDGSGVLIWEMAFDGKANKMSVLLFGS